VRRPLFRRHWGQRGMMGRILTRGAMVILFLALLFTLLIKMRGFRASSTPTRFETLVARLVRDFAIPRSEKTRTNPYAGDDEALRQGRREFLSRCGTCHGDDGRGVTPIGTNVYPRVPDLHNPLTQNLTDGELRYIIAHGIQLTGMPAMPGLDGQEERISWALVTYLRSLRTLTSIEATHRQSIISTAQYVGSRACERCHADIYQRWKRTPMANVVRDPREHPDAIIPDLKTNTVAPFTIDQVAFVYGSKWKQRYFTRLGDDYYPLPVQWDIGNKTWRPYHVADTGADWWTAYYPSDNLQRPTGPTCDGCHAVNYDIRAKKPAEWNVGCERCHGPGSDHVSQPMRTNTFNPSTADAIASTDTCVQCHSQGQPRSGLIEGKAYDWPVGYQVGLRLQDYWKLEPHILGETSFTHYADGSAHKNRMQGNDFVQSLMYRRGVTCASCHDAHGTDHYAQLRKPVETICLDCHAPNGANGPHVASFEAHTRHKTGSTGSQCIACHMPKIASEGVPGSFVSAHTFRFLTPSMTAKYKIPNPCASCHTDKSSAWIAEALKSWSGVSPWRVE
jgi:predicted CXXCH cytochrome family protein